MSVTYEPFSFALSQNLLKSLRDDYAFATFSVIGRSVAKRGIFAMTVGEGEENVLMLSGLNGMDGVSPLLLYRFFERLCQSYADGSTLCGVQIRNSLYGRRLTVVPCANPDAVEIRRSGVLGAGCYAGLVHRAAGDGFADWCANARGVNVAHNFNYHHKPMLFDTANAPSDYIRPSPCAYAGPAPESEEETRAVVRLCAREPFRHALLLGGTGKRVFWASPETPCDTQDVPMMARVLAAAGDYTLSSKAPALTRGSFPAWFAQTMRSPAFEIAAGEEEPPADENAFEALYRELEEMLVLAAIM